MNRWRGVALVAVAVVVSGTVVARADDSDQIEKATNLIRDCDKWLVLSAYQHALDCLAQAEKELQGVDETGKADTVTSIKEKRDQIAKDQAQWANLEPSRRASAFEREINAADNTGEHDAEGCEEKLKFIEAALADKWIKANTDDAWRAALQKKIDWTRKKTNAAWQKEKTRGVTDMLRREFEEVENVLQNQKGAHPGSSFKEDFDNSVNTVDQTLSDDANQKALGADGLAQARKRLDGLKTDFASALVANKFALVEEWSKWIQDVLDGKEKHAYTSDVENKFKLAGEQLDKLPQDDPRGKKLRDKLAEQRKTFDSQQSQGDRDQAVQPVVKWWATCNESYGKDSQGWEQETTPSTLQDFTHHAPASLGCDKTEKYLEEVVQRFFDADMVKNAVAKYPNDPELKKTVDEAKGQLEKAGAKLCKFANSILDEGEKLPMGRDRDDLVQQFYNLKVTINHATTGCSEHDALIKRIDSLDKRFGQEKDKAAADKQALTAKMTAATKEVWPSIISGWNSKARDLDASDALKNIGAWTGTVVHFTGGAQGVSWNRSGWNWEDTYDFIIENNGIPVCGNLDKGLAEALTKVSEDTGIEQGDLEECVGIVDGTCTAWERVQDPFDHNRYLRGRQIDGVRVRIVAWNAGTICAGVGKGTTLQKLEGHSDISVAEKGASSHNVGGGFGHMIHRFVAWFMCLLLAAAGALSLAHGASKFVAPVQDAKAKLGDGLGYAGWGFTAVGAIWFVAAIVCWLIGMCEFGSLPSLALLFAGVGLGLDLLRSKGKLKPETASMIQPVSILFGLGCFAAAFLHFLFWDVMLL